MIFQLARYVDWPKDYFKGRQTFNINVLGDSEIHKILNSKLNNRTLKKLKIRVSDSLDLKNSQVVFLGKKSAEIVDLKGKLSQCSCLIIGTKGKNWEVITLKRVKDKIRFEVNLIEAKRRGLYISSRILNLAINVIGKY